MKPCCTDNTNAQDVMHCSVLVGLNRRRICVSDVYRRFGRTQSTGSFIYTHIKRHAGGRYFRFSTNSNMFPCNTAFHHSKDHTTTHAALHPGNTHVTETVQKT